MLPLAEIRLTLLCVKTLNDTQANAPVVEVACVKVRNFQVTERRVFLLNPETRLPEEFTRQTGLYDASLKAHPILETVLPEIAAFIERDFIVWVGQSGQSTPVHRKLHRTQPRDKELYLATLAETTLPDLSRYGLADMARALGLDAAGLQRAEAAVTLGAQVLIRLLGQLQEEQGVETLDDLLARCPQRKKARRNRNHLPFDREQLKHYPTLPGVYFMKNRLGEILYVGKAKNLRARLRSYFQKQSRLPAKVAAMMQQVAMIDVQTVGSELEALLLEARLIKWHQPFFNRKVKDYQRMVFIRVTQGEAFPRISTAVEPEDPDSTYFGPFQGKMGLEARLDVLNRVFKLRSCSDRDFEAHRDSPCMQHQIGLCSGPCAGLISRADYRAQVEDFMRYLGQAHCHTVDTLIAKREAYAEALLFEKAAALQEQLDQLETLQLRSSRLVEAVTRHNCLIVLPHTEPEACRLLCVLQGQPVAWHTVYPQVDDDETLGRMLSPLFADMGRQAETTAGAGIAKIFYEESRLLGQWLEEASQAEGAVVYLNHKSSAQVLGELRLLLSAWPDAGTLADEDWLELSANG